MGLMVVRTRCHCDVLWWRTICLLWPFVTTFLCPGGGCRSRLPVYHPGAG